MAVYNERNYEFKRQVNGRLGTPYKPKKSVI